jgi:hypothetical protein
MYMDADHYLHLTARLQLRDCNRDQNHEHKRCHACYACLPAYVAVQSPTNSVEGVAHCYVQPLTAVLPAAEPLPCMNRPQSAV